MTSAVDMLYAHCIAETFAANLRARLTCLDWCDMGMRNRTYPAGICASHDFCDANVYMQAAFETVMQRDLIVEDANGDIHHDERDGDLWNAAWDIAKAGYLTA